MSFLNAKRIQGILRSQYFWGIVIAFFLTSFLIGRGIWLIQDNVYNAKTPLEAMLHFWRFFSATSLTDNFQTWFGYDATFFNVSRMSYLVYLLFVVIFRNAGFAQYLFLFLYVFLAFIVQYFFVRLLTKHHVGSLIGALLFVSAQYSFFFYSLPGFVYSLVALQIIVLSAHAFLTNEKKKTYAVLGIVLGFYALVSYSRTFEMYALTLVVVAMVYAKAFWKQRIRVLKALPIVILGSFPLLYSYGSKVLGGDYVTSFGIYQSYYKEIFGSSAYRLDKIKNVFDFFVLQSPYTSFISLTNNAYHWLLLVLSFLLGVCIVWGIFFFVRDKKVRVLLGLAYLSSFIAFVAARILPKNIYIKLTYDVFPFLANNTGHILIIALLVSSVVCGFLVARLGGIKKWILVGIVLLFCFVSVAPMWRDTVKTEKFSFDAMPKEYRETFYEKKTNLDSTLFLPTADAGIEDPFGLEFPWSIYPFEFSQNTNYVPLATSNSRFINRELGEFFAQLRTYPLSRNSEYFDLRNIFIFKDVKNVSDGLFDYYRSNYDYESSQKKLLEEASENPNFIVQDENEHFSHFAPKDASRADYLLYSPQNIVQRKESEIFKGDDVDLAAPMFIAQNSNAPVSVDEFYSEEINDHDVKLSIKASNKNQNLFYVKTGKDDTKSPFILVLNKTFWPTWKIVPITQAQYEKISCNTKTDDYEATQNTLCWQKENLFGLEYLKFLFARPVKAEHFKGNYIGNAWKVDPANLHFSEDNQTYFAVVNMKQVYYTFSLGIGFFGMLWLFTWLISSLWINSRRVRSYPPVKTMPNTTLVSVVMSNWNGSQYLRESIESMLNQSYRDFEYLLLDDGSTDSSKDIIREYAAKDPRIVMVLADQNVGLTRTLNKGIAMAKGKYIVRMDSDDVSELTRIEKQVSFMEKPENARVGVCGSYCSIIDKAGKQVAVKKFPTTDQEIRKAIWYRNPIQHSSAIIRKEAIVAVGDYHEEFLQSEDFELWLRIGTKYEFRNIPEVLLRYRIHGENIVLKKQKRMIYQILKARRMAYRDYGYSMSAKDSLFYIGTTVALILPAKVTLWLFNRFQTSDK